MVNTLTIVDLIIEYQHREMPHAYIVAQLNNISKEYDIQDCIQWTDRHISAQLSERNEIKYH